MNEIARAVEWAIDTATDNSHGYDQTNRWGPDYDCSSFVITAYENAGVPVKTNGAGYTGNMVDVFIKTGFIDVTNAVTLGSGAGLKSGDVLWVSGHTEMVCSDRQIVGASINENGETTGGQTGDQTGNEIRVRSYYNYPWTMVLRWPESAITYKWISGNRVLTEEEMQNNAAYIYLYMREMGWPRNVVAAMLGNMEEESYINPGIWQSLKEGNTSGGYGLVQWTPATKYIDWAGADWDTNHDKQLLKIEDELQNGGQWVKRRPYTDWTFSQFKNSTADPYTLACVFAWNYEGSAVVLYGTDSEKEALKQRRGAAAEKWYSYLEGISGRPPRPSSVLPLWLLFKLRRRNFVK